MSGYWSMWARCKCCGFEGFRHDSGYCGECSYTDHTACQVMHSKIRRTKRDGTRLVDEL